MVDLVLFVYRVAIDSLLVEIGRQPVAVANEDEVIQPKAANTVDEISRQPAAANVDIMERRRRIITTLVWFIVTLLIALFIPDIGVVISLLGGLAAVFIFVFPGL